MRREATSTVKVPAALCFLNSAKWSRASSALEAALAWSGVGLIAFVPLAGLAVFPLQLAALVLRGLVFEYLGLTALAAYTTLYHRHVAQFGAATDRSRVDRGLVKSTV